MDRWGRGRGCGRWYDWRLVAADEPHTICCFCDGGSRDRQRPVHVTREWLRQTWSLLRRRFYQLSSLVYFLWWPARGVSCFHGCLSVLRGATCVGEGQQPCCYHYRGGGVLVRVLNGSLNGPAWCLPCVGLVSAFVNLCQPEFSLPPPLTA